jgi:hypothetical protein
MAVRSYSEAIFGPASTIDPAMQLIIGAGASQLRPAEPPGPQGPSYPVGQCPPGYSVQLVDGHYQCVPNQLTPHGSRLGISF